MNNSLEGFLDNIAAAATNDSSTLKQLVNSMAQLTATNAMQQQTIADLRKEMATIRETQRCEVTAIKKKLSLVSCVKGTYCWSHGYRVGPGHTSAMYRDGIPANKRDATRANTKGGLTVNKGWDE